MLFFLFKIYFSISTFLSENIHELTYIECYKHQVKTFNTEEPHVSGGALKSLFEMGSSDVFRFHSDPEGNTEYLSYFSVAHSLTLPKIGATASIICFNNQHNRIYFLPDPLVKR